jgi:hypothetical protein
METEETDGSIGRKTLKNQVLTLDAYIGSKPYTEEAGNRYSLSCTASPRTLSGTNNST